MGAGWLQARFLIARLVFVKPLILQRLCYLRCDQGETVVGHRAAVSGGERYGWNDSERQVYTMSTSCRGPALVVSIGISDPEARRSAIKLSISQKLASRTRSVDSHDLSLLAGDGCVHLRAEPPQRRFLGTRPLALFRCRAPRWEYDRELELVVSMTYPLLA